MIVDLPDTSKCWQLTIEVMPHGGYVVKRPYSPVTDRVVALFASTELKDCFKFIDKQLYRPESR